MDTSDNHLQVEFDLQYQNLKADFSKLEKLVRGICETFKVGEAAIDVSIVDDAGIIEVHRKGYMYKDRVLRAAMVTVAKALDNSCEKADENRTNSDE